MPAAQVPTAGGDGSRERRRVNVQRMVGAPALVDAMRRDGSPAVRRAAGNDAGRPAAAARRSVPTVGAHPQAPPAPGARAGLRVVPAE